MGISIFPQASAGGTSNLTTADLTTHAPSLTRMTKQATYQNTQTGLTYAASINWVYALVIGGGGGGQAAASNVGNVNFHGGVGSGGAVSFGVTRPSSRATVGAGGNGGSQNATSNTESSGVGGNGGSSTYGTIHAPGGTAGYSLFNGSQNFNHSVGLGSLLASRTALATGGTYSSSQNNSGVNLGTSNLQGYNIATQGDAYFFTANGSSGSRADTSQINSANVGVGLPTIYGGFNGGARAGGANVGGNQFSPIRGGGGAGYLGNGGAASNTAGGNGGAGGGGGGSAGPYANWDNSASNWGNSSNANGGQGGAGVVELYY